MLYVDLTLRREMSFDSMSSLYSRYFHRPHRDLRDGPLLTGGRSEAIAIQHRRRMILYLPRINMLTIHVRDQRVGR